MNQQELMNAVRQCLTMVFSMLTILAPTLASSANFSAVQTAVLAAVPALCTIGSIGWSVYAHWNMVKVPENVTPPTKGS